jgi:hypothetical protein
LYGCEAWSLTLREERRLKVSENRVLRRVFGPKRDEVTRKWRKLHNEELIDLYSLLSRHTSPHGTTRNDTIRYATASPQGTYYILINLNSVNLTRNLQNP